MVHYSGYYKIPYVPFYYLRLCHQSETAFMKHLFISPLFLLFTSFSLFSQEIKVSVFKPQGGGVSWSPDGKRICYDMKGPSEEHYYEMHTANPDGSLDTCISCLNTDLPHKETGSPHYHPSGKYIIFVSEKPFHEGSHVTAIPGFGGFSDIWVMTPDGKKAWKVFETRNDINDGIIAPKFSHDGKHVVWVERTKSPHPLVQKEFFGLWVITTADFIIDENGTPKLVNIKKFDPDGEAFYETYGYSPDDKRIIFCSNYNVRFWWSCGIFTIDTVTGKDIKQLTTNDYNEHATYTPDGKHILWMTNTCADKQGTDWWIMNTDGSKKQRLTYFNEPTNPEYNGHKKWACYGSFSPDGKSFVGGAQTSLLKQEGLIYKVDFFPCDSGDGLKGEYYDGEDFIPPFKVHLYKCNKSDTNDYHLSQDGYWPPDTRFDPAINFRWGPSWKDTMLKSDSYSIRWTGFVEPLYSETYTLYTPDDKNISVWVDGNLVIDASIKTNQFDEKNTQIVFEKGKKYSLKVEYHNSLKNRADVNLAWSSEHQYKQVIPMSQLFTDK